MLGKKSSAAFGQDRFAWFKRLDFLPKGSISQKIRPLSDFGDLHVFFVDFFFEVEKKKRWSFYWKTLGNFKRCNCKDDFVELEAVKSLLQSFRTAEETLQAAEARKKERRTRSHAPNEGRLQTDKIKPLINFFCRTLDICIQAWIFYVILM